MIRIWAIVAFLVAAEAGAWEIRHAPSGAEIRWRVEDVYFVFDESLSDLGPRDGVEAAIALAFEEWVERAGVPISFWFWRGQGGEAGYDPGGENSNQILAEAGPGAGPDEPCARAVVTYDPESGEILDADLVFYADCATWGLDGDPLALDLRAVATHEAGHAIGLGHSDVEEATMFPLVEIGSTAARDLAEDDIEGASALYRDEPDPDQGALVGCETGPVAQRACGKPPAALLAAILGFY